MKTLPEARHLAQLMIDIGRAHGRCVKAVLSDMDAPLGTAVGNAVEIEEAVRVLHGEGCPSLTELCLTLVSLMAEAALAIPREEARIRAEAAIADGAAHRKLCEWVAAQGGDVTVLRDTNRLPKAAHSAVLCADADGYFCGIDAEAVGLTAMRLGAGRAVKEDTIDPSAGILLCRRIGDRVTAGEPIATLLTTSHPDRLPSAFQALKASVRIGDEAPKKAKIILDILG